MARHRRAAPSGSGRVARPEDQRPRSAVVTSHKQAQMTDATELELLAIARAAAVAAAGGLQDRFGERPRGVRAKSSPTDLVSEADLSAESAIREVLSRLRPSDAILGEEGGETGAAELRWVVDPLDGTANFLFGIPVFAVSVACENAAGSIAGVVLDPVRRERFEATRSGGPTLNGEGFHVAQRAQSLDQALVATGFGFDSEVRAAQANVLVRVLPRVRDIRRVGAAALDLCWCACGRYDAYYERGLRAWDSAAGALIASSAGLEVRELAARPNEPAGILAAPVGLVDELLALVETSVTTDPAPGGGAESASYSLSTSPR